MKIEDINCCQVCHGIDLIQKRAMIDDVFGIISEKTVKICKDCDTLHYIHGGHVYYEFSLNIREKYELIFDETSDMFEE